MKKKVNEINKQKDRSIKISSILSVILIVLGVINSGLFLLFGLFGSFICGKPFYVISGSEGPIPSCKSIFNTDFVWIILLGICLILIGIVLIVLGRKNCIKDNLKNQ